MDNLNCQIDKNIYYFNREFQLFEFEILANFMPNNRLISNNKHVSILFRDLIDQ